MRASRTSRVVLLLTMLGVAKFSLAQAPASAPTPAPKGKVLFERHEPAVTGTPQETTPEPADEPAEKPAAGVSSSRSRHARATLRRRSEEVSGSAPASAEAPTTTATIEAAVSSSSSSEDVQEDSVLVTVEDRAAAARVSAAERASLLIAATDLDLHLNNSTGQVEARAQLRVLNSGSQPIRQIALRVSGALHWESVRLAGAAAPLPLQQHRLQDDLDHTGVATEIVVPLPEPLAPGATLSLDSYYSGRITASTQRLVAMGAPAGRAALTDWDTVTETFTGLRGMGSVLWYPVAGAPALLRDGAAVTEAVEASRTRNAKSQFRLRLTLEYTGSRPDAAFFCGVRQLLQPLAPVGPALDNAGVVTAEWTRAHLGAHTPSLFVAGSPPHEVADGLLRVVTDRADAVAGLGEAAARVRPMLAEWLGATPQRPLDVLDLPLPSGAGFSDGSLLVAPLTSDASAALATSLVQPLSSAWLPQEVAAPWLREGLPTFLQAVWVERIAGRAAALTGLAASFQALRAQAASPSSVSSSSQGTDFPAAMEPAVAACTDAACTRAKAAYVFEMLRGMLGDAPLQQAISGWAVQAAQSPEQTSAAGTSALETLLQQVAGKRQLDWFFQSWVERNQGLPDLRIVTVAPRRVERASPINYLPQARKPVAGPIGAEPVAPTDPRDMSERDAAAYAAANGDGAGPAPGSWLVAVEVQNAGSADAEVPVTVRSGGLTNTLPLHIAAHSRATVRVPFEADPQEVLVNDGSVPEVNGSTHRTRIGSLPPAP